MASLTKVDLLVDNTPEQKNLSPILLADNHHTSDILQSPSSVATNSIEIDRTIKSPLVSQCTRSKKREVYRFETDWLISSLAWSNEPGEPLQLALSSYIEDYTNHVQLVSLARDTNDQELKSVATFYHPYPATKILWIPRSADNHTYSPRLLATTADYLRIWRVQENKSNSLTQAGGYLNRSVDSTDSLEVEVKLECLLNSNRGSKLCTPLTSFDWNDADPNMIVTSSVDTTCAVWDLETSTLVSSTRSPQSEFLISGSLRTQLVAHDHQVYDVSFSRFSSSRSVFVSSSGDGSVRLFDLRRLSTSTVLYEVDGSKPFEQRALVRVSCSKLDTNLVSTFASNSNEILIIDIRNPGRPVGTLSNHTANLNGMSWAAHSAHHICSAADDCQALIWELSKLPDPIAEPLLAYRAGGKINAISWSFSQPDWIAIGFQNYLELLRV